jgi:hypothetical protein
MWCETNQLLTFCNYDDPMLVAVLLYFPYKSTIYNEKMNEEPCPGEPIRHWSGYLRRRTSIAL